MNTQTPVTTNQERNISDNVLNRINAFVAAGTLRIPDGYSPENALKSAFLILNDTVDKDKNPVLTVCDQNSIANTLLDMVIQGLSPVKKQCYFIAYGKKLTLSRSYMGTIAVAKRVGMEEVNSQVIYEGDKFHYIVDKNTGRKQLVEHIQDFKNIDNDKILGAYAITIMKDGKTDLEVMNINQIKKAWQQGQGKGITGAHTNFGDQMCKKTVENRACKLIINTSDDRELYKADHDKMDVDIEDQDAEDVTAKMQAKEEIKDNGNKGNTLSIDENKTPSPTIEIKDTDKVPLNKTEPGTQTSLESNEPGGPNF